MSWAEAASNLGKSLPTLIFALVVFIIGIILVAKGKITFHGKGLTIGEKKESQELERKILKTQLEMGEASITEMIRGLPKEYQNYKGYYIGEKVYDKVVKWIALNNITKDDFYKSIKKEEIHNLVYNLMDKTKLNNPDFIMALDPAVDSLIDRLVDIRSFYEKGKK